jgi:hypothetical protein
MERWNKFWKWVYTSEDRSAVFAVILIVLGGVFLMLIDFLYH